MGLLTVPFNQAKAQNSQVSQKPGYYYSGSQTQAFQTSGVRTDHRGIMNGGVNVGPVGVQGYNNGNTYTYPQQQTQYKRVDQFYYSNGNSCDAKIYNDYQMPSKSPVYDQYGRPYQQSVIPNYPQSTSPRSEISGRRY